MIYQVAVCGPAECRADEAARARRVGELLAERGAVVLCGGGAGVMAAVAAGARGRGGLVVGIRPDAGRGGSDLSAVIVTDMGEARNAIIVQSADAVISVGGSWGTLSEIALARRRGGIPVIALGGWRVLDENGNPVPGIDHVDTPEAAVAAAMSGRDGRDPDEGPGHPGGGYFTVR
ncbi:dethiobiotin synthetase [Actinoplanes sp. NPDC023714]|uniref:SLOG cluster 4 domain-containing protein n=1 Tax=Actinoplanes sp. NPDC023714 TaxID=3154322 RepID=UPI00340938DD